MRKKAFLIVNFSAFEMLSVNHSSEDDLPILLRQALFDHLVNLDDYDEFDSCSHSVYHESRTLQGEGNSSQQINDLIYSFMVTYYVKQSVDVKTPTKKASNTKQKSESLTTHSKEPEKPESLPGQDTQAPDTPQPEATEPEEEPDALELEIKDLMDNPGKNVRLPPHELESVKYTMPYMDRKEQARYCDNLTMLIAKSPKHLHQFLGDIRTGQPIDPAMFQDLGVVNIGNFAYIADQSPEPYGSKAEYFLQQYLEFINQSE